MFAVEQRLDEEKRGRLERSWAHQYRTHALRLIDEARFSKYFSLDNGRPNKSVRLVVSVLVLKERFDLTDEEALEQLEWNTAWHYALDVLPEEAHSCQKTLHNFRAMLLGDDAGAGLFESTTARLIESAGLKTGRQRQDSTHIMSNIRVLTRLGLFVQTVTKFLAALKRQHPRICGQVSKELTERYLEREGYFSDARGSEAARRLGSVACDIHHLVRRFQGHQTVSTMESYGLLTRLYEEQCIPAKEEVPEKVKLVEVPSSSSLQSAADPDATYGHKGKGYEVQLTETCGEENAFEVVTSVGLSPANETDHSQVIPALEQVERTCGSAPTTMHADAGYSSGDNILAALAHGTDLAAPMRGTGNAEGMPTLRDFKFDESGKQLLACPRGELPIEQREYADGKTLVAFFTRKQCSGCPLRAQCPVGKTRTGKRVLRFKASEVAVIRRRVEQQTRAFKERHRMRSGIEATNSELKRAHGLRKLRVRRIPPVALSVRLKSLALNIKRYVQHLTRTAAAAEAACA